MRCAIFLPQHIEFPPTLFLRDFLLGVVPRHVNKAPNRQILHGNGMCFEPELISDVQDQRKWNVEVTRDEGLSIPMAMDEHSISRGQQQHQKQNQRSPREPRLERCRPRQFSSAIDPLSFAAIVEAKIGDQHNNPVRQSADSDEILKPCECGRSGIFQSHVAECHKDGKQTHCNPGNAEAVQSSEDLGCLSCVCHAEEYTRAC